MNITIKKDVKVFKFQNDEDVHYIVANSKAEAIRYELAASGEKYKVTEVNRQHLQSIKCTDGNTGYYHLKKHLKNLELPFAFLSNWT